MNGIIAKPIPTVVIDATRGVTRFGNCFKIFELAQHVRLMINEGIPTDANNCQPMVSTNEKVANDTCCVRVKRVFGIVDDEFETSFFCRFAIVDKF